MYKLNKIAPATFEMPQEGAMRVPGLVIANEELLQAKDIEEPLKQVVSVASLPGIVGYSIAMPDIHWGYGFPIGGVAAMDAETGVISPGGVGYDINCGVRLAHAPLKMRDIDETKRKKLLQRLFELIPSGVGHGRLGTPALTAHDYKELIDKGSSWSVDKGFGFTEDLLHTESYGCLKGADVNNSLLKEKALLSA